MLTIHVLEADGEETLIKNEAYQDIKKEEAYVKESIATLLYEDNSEAIPQDFNPVLQYDQAEKVYLEEMPKTKTAQDGILDYGAVKSRLEEYESNPNVLGGGQSDETGENSGENLDIPRCIFYTITI